MSEEEERALAPLVRAGDADAIDRLVLANLRFVVRIAGWFARSVEELEDLVQEGAIGLREAAVRFDPERGARFLTYATYWIDRAIYTAVRKHMNVVNVQHSHLKASLQYHTAKERFHEEHRRMPTREELAGLLGCTLEELERQRRTAARVHSASTVLSLDKPLYDDGATLGDRLADGAEQIDPFRDSDTHALLGILPDDQAEVMRRTYGFLSEHQQSDLEISAAMGMSTLRVGRLKRVALKTLTAEVRNTWMRAR